MQCVLAVDNTTADVVVSNIAKSTCDVYGGIIIRFKAFPRPKEEQSIGREYVDIHGETTVTRVPLMAQEKDLTSIAN